MRFGVVGTGHWATTIHAAGLAAHPEAELVGIWGRDLAKAEAAAAAHGAEGFDDYSAFLEAVDAVSFAVPPAVQVPAALGAAAKGRPLLLEKPIATSLEQADALVEAAADVASVVFFTSRFVPAWEDWLDTMARRSLLGGEIHWLSSLDTPGNPFADSPWRRDFGALWDVGPHALSLLLPMLGPVVDIAGARGHRDLVHLVLTHEGGAASTVSLSLTMPPTAQRWEVSVYDEAGWHPQPDDPRDVAACYATAVSELVDAATTGVPHRCDVRFGRDVVKVLARAEAVLSPGLTPPSASPTG
ncbi:MAG TPA: Gfo/Idh/MocA family oxidoreductase [Nocardioidaceae bacterium]|nr:Gfo/Idh/MocA family oxidoreductase [Nocardioidaceae bacterium]